MPGKPDDRMTGAAYLATVIDPLVAAGLYPNRGAARKVFGGRANGRTRKQVRMDAIAEIKKGTGN